MNCITCTYDYELMHEGKKYTITHGTYEITVDQAQTLLMTNTNNRKPKPGNRAKIERAHLEGNWKYTGDVIQLDDKGVLLNGQHRLSAAVNVGRDLIIPVVTGLPTDYFQYMDISKPRSSQDAFGIYGIKNPASASKVVIFLWQLGTGRYPESNGAAENPAPPEAVDLFFQFGDVGSNLLDKHIARGNSANLTHLNATAVGTLSFLFSQEDEELNDLFWEGVIQGLNITDQNDARKALIDYIDRRWKDTQKLAIGGKQGLRVGMVAKCIQFAWNNWMEGKKIKKGQFRWEKVEAELEQKLKASAATVISQPEVEKGQAA